MKHEACSMEHDGSRVAADLSHEGAGLIRENGEPGSQRRAASACTAGVHRKLANDQSRWLEEDARNTALGKCGRLREPADGDEPK